MSQIVATFTPNVAGVALRAASPEKPQTLLSEGASREVRPMERWLSGLKHRFRKPAWGNPSRVRISPSPPVVLKSSDKIPLFCATFQNRKVLKYKNPKGIRTMYKELDQEDKELISAAVEVIKRNYRDPRHTVGAAVLAESGKVYVGVNVDSCGYGPCAEPIAVGTAISNEERTFKRIVAVGGRDGENLMSPCGNCRQLILDYAPDAEVILMHEGKAMKASIKDLIPDSYSNFVD